MKDTRPNHHTSTKPEAKSAFKLTFQWLLKIAAMICIIVLGYGALQFAIVHPDFLYDDLFVSYTLSIGSHRPIQMTTLDSLYLEKNYQGVIGSFQSQTEQSEQDYFLTAVSYMQSEQYEQAILLFLQLQQSNQPGNRKHKFQEETDYYLALSYLKAGQITNALDLFEKIHQQPEHPFHADVSQLTLWKLKLLEMKQ